MSGVPADETMTEENEVPLPADEVSSPNSTYRSVLLGRSEIHNKTCAKLV
jgi:hypothetical protein